MKKTIKLISSLVLALVLVCSMTVTSFASTVTYEGDAREFVFQPGSECSPTDLFTNFKGVMPGDTLTQVVNVKNDASKKVDVEILMKADGAVGLYDVSQEDSADFLKEMNLTVTAENGSELFNAPADQTAGLTDWVSLGHFKSGADVDLNVALNVPITMGNDFQQRIGALDWTFKVIEKPIPTETTAPPTENPKDDGAKTGDDMNVFLLGGICLAALAVIVVLAATKRRKA